MAEREPLAGKIKDAIPLQNHWETFVDWLLDKTELFAQKYRYTLTAHLINLALEIQRKIIHARFQTKKLEVLEEIHIDLEVMSGLLRHCFHKKLLAANSFEHACQQLEEASKMVAGWKKYQGEKEKHHEATEI